jgi:hypothetical protein
VLRPRLGVGGALQQLTFGHNLWGDRETLISGGGPLIKHRFLHPL